MVENKEDKKILRAAKFLVATMRLGTPEAAERELATLAKEKPKRAALVKDLIREALNRPVSIAGPFDVPLPEGDRVSPRQTILDLKRHLQDLREREVAESAEVMVTDEILAASHPKLRWMVAYVLMSDLGAITVEIVHKVFPGLIESTAPGRKRAPQKPPPVEMVEEPISAMETRLKGASNALADFVDNETKEGTPLRSRALEVKLLVDYALGRAQFLGHAVRGTVEP